MPPFPPPIDPSYIPSVSLTKIPATAPIEDMITILERDGGLILTDLVSRQDIAAVNHGLEPYIQKAKVEDTHAAYDLVPNQTVMVSGVVGKSPTMARIAEFEVINRLRTLTLQKKCTATWKDRTKEFTIGPLLNSSFNETILGSLESMKFALRKWIRFLSTVYHSAKHNPIPDQVRKLYSLFFIPDTLRPEKNQFLTIPRSKVLEMSDIILSLLGYKKPETWLGIVNNGDSAENPPEVLSIANS